MMRAKYSYKTGLWLFAMAMLGSSSLFAGAVHYQADIEASQIAWKGSKVGGHHRGTVGLKSGSLTFENGALAGGQFEIDLTTIQNSDLKGGRKGKLERHLKSEDFFSVETHPSALLKITEATKGDREGEYDVVAQLSIKGISKELRFKVHAESNGESAKANASIIVDRTVYDISFRSGSFFEKLGDKLIYDDFNADVELVLKKG